MEGESESSGRTKQVDCSRVRSVTIISFHLPHKRSTLGVHEATLVEVQALTQTSAVDVRAAENALFLVGVCMIFSFQIAFRWKTNCLSKCGS